MNENVLNVYLCFPNLLSQLVQVMFHVMFLGATVTHQNKWGESALSYACYQGYHEVRILLVMSLWSLVKLWYSLEWGSKIKNRTLLRCETQIESSMCNIYDSEPNGKEKHWKCDCAWQPQLIHNQTWIIDLRMGRATTLFRMC